MKILKLLKISDFITFLNAASGLLCIFFAYMNLFHIAALVLLAAVAFDYFDGRSARKRGISNEFGTEIDSLSDMISFGIAPSCFVFMLIGDIRFAPLYALFVVAGIMRLARFNITKIKDKHEGMPITVNGIIVPILYLFNVSALVYYVYFFLASLFMVSSFRLKKI